MIRIGFINELPFGFAFGGKEIQLLSYEKYLNTLFPAEVKTSRLDYWNKEYLDNVDVLHFFGCTNSIYDMITVFSGKNSRKKIIVSPTIYYKERFKAKVGGILANICPLPNYFSYKREIFRKSDNLIVNSNNEKEQICDIFGKKFGKKISVIYNAIEKDYNSFENENNKNIFLENYNLEPGYLLSVGFMDERKNSLNLIKAFLNKKIDKKLVIVGGLRYRSINDRDLIIKIMEENKDRIINIPYLERNSYMMKSAYYNCAAHVLPSFVETPGLSNLEALYFGKPLYVGECKPVREYFGDYAIYCDPFSLKSIEGGIEKAVELTKDPAFSNNAINFVKKNFIYEAVIPELYGIYKK